MICWEEPGKRLCFMIGLFVFLNKRLSWQLGCRIAGISMLMTFMCIYVLYHPETHQFIATYFFLLLLLFWRPTWHSCLSIKKTYILGEKKKKNSLSWSADLLAELEWFSWSPSLTNWKVEHEKGPSLHINLLCCFSVVCALLFILLN